MIPEPSPPDRLVLGLMDHHKIGHAQAVSRLENLRLVLRCDENIAGSPSLQAALLTAVNTGKRCFLGGVAVSLPASVPLRLPWPGATTLNEALESISGPQPTKEGEAHTILFGFTDETVADETLVVCSSGWWGGVVPARGKLRVPGARSPDFALGGIFAGALAVHRGFLRVAGISSSACDQADGLSLWQPRAEWRSREAEGPQLGALPRDVWLLGLGHLGQSFCWAIGLLPYDDPAQCSILLQDFDSIETGNVGSSLLADAHDVGLKKTRLCCRWLEARKFKTTLTERPFDQHTCRRLEEPALALCGFDKEPPRRYLDEAGFLKVVECGLGRAVSDFDIIQIHHLPGQRRAQDIWPEGESDQVQPSAHLIREFSNGDEECGALVLEAASRAVSTSFVGAMAGTVVLGEVVRGFSGGEKFDELLVRPRKLGDSQFRTAGVNYSASEMASLGFVRVLTQNDRPPW